MIDFVEVVSILLATGALVVSLAALYTTALRGAEIGVDIELIGGELGSGGGVNNVPSDDRLRLCLALSNTGAHGGLVEGIKFAEIEYIGKHPQLWTGVSNSIVTFTDTWSQYETARKVTFPIALEAGDIQTVYLNGPWVRSRDEGEYDPGQAPVYSYAERLRGLREVRVVIQWTYRRVAGGWRSLIPGRGRTRETVTERAEVTLPGGPWVEACAAMWSSEPNYSRETAAILRGEEPPQRPTG
jgi:hypothetical protein